jgi:hypothetical protein
MSYLINWFHAYVIHFGVWASFVIASSVHTKGIPSFDRLPGLLKSSMVIAAILSVFSSHSHVHYASYLAQLVK